MNHLTCVSNWLSKCVKTRQIRWNSAVDRLFLFFFILNLCFSITSWLKQQWLWSSSQVRFRSVSQKLFLCSCTLVLVRHLKSSNKNISYWRKTCCHVGGSNLFKVINEGHIFFSVLVFCGFWQQLQWQTFIALVLGTSWNRNHIALLWCFDDTFMPAALKLQINGLCCFSAKLQIKEKSNCT